MLPLHQINCNLRVIGLERCRIGYIECISIAHRLAAASERACRIQRAAGVVDRADRTGAEDEEAAADRSG